MPLNRINITWPSKGYAETPAYGEQPPNTSPDMLNVMVFDPISQRARLAQRAGTGPYDLFNFATGTPMGTLTGGGGTITLSPVSLPGDGVSTTDPSAPAVNIPYRGCYTVTPSNPSFDVLTSGSGCGPTTVVVGGQPNNGGSTLSGSITFSPGGGGGGGGGTGGGFPGPGSIVLPVNQPPAGGGGSPPVTDPEKPFLQVRRCSDNVVMGWVHQNILSAFNAIPAILVGGVCCQVTGLRETATKAVPVLTPDEITEDCSKCDDVRTWLQLTSCVSGADGVAVDVWLRKDHYVAAGGGDLYFKASDTVCYKCPSDAATTHTQPAHEVTVYLPKDDCDACQNSKIWYHVYQWTYDCTTGPDSAATYDRTQCLDPEAVQAENQWFRVDVINGKGVYEYYVAAGPCSDGDTPPSPGAIPDPPVADDIGGFPPSECQSCTPCGLMCLSSGTELDSLSWDLTTICAVANCSDFAGVLTYNNSGTSFIWDGSFIQNDIPEDTPAFGPFAVDLGNGWTGSAHMNCAKTNPGDGSIDFGGFLVTLSNGPASLQLNYVASDADGDPAINGELRLALSSVSYHSSTPNCPPSGACDSPGTQAVTGETILNDVCCRNVDTCRVGTPQPGSDDGPTAMGECA